MNWLHTLLLTLAAVFIVLLPLSRRWAWSYARVTALLLISTVILLPFAWLACAAFKDPAVLNKYTFLPPASEMNASTLNLKNFQTLFDTGAEAKDKVGFWRYFTNSLFLASAGASISLFFCSLGGYALAKYQFRGRTVLLTFMLASLTVPGVLFLAPTYKLVYELGWMDSYAALLIPGAVSVFGIFLFRQAMLDIPSDLIEAGRIDGCGEFRIYFQLVMPLVRPMIGAYCLISFLGSWNTFISPQIYLQSQQKLTLPVVLNQYINMYNQQYGVFLAGTLIAIIPPAVLFFALQREFISGLQSGALKQ